MRLLAEIRNYMGNYHLKSGIYHYYRNEFLPAIGFLRKAMAEDPDVADGERASARKYLTLCHKGLAERLEASGEIDRGVEELDRAIELSPGYPDLHYRKGRLLERLARRDEATAAYRRAIDCQADYLDARIALGFCLLADGRDRAATVAFKQALGLKLERARRPFRRALEALAASRPDEARDHLEDTFLGQPRLAEEYLKKALDWIRVEKYAEALIELDHALELSPKYPDLHNYRGIVLCELKRVEEAVISFRRSAALGPGHLIPKLNLAFALLRAERFDEAEAELESVLVQDPGEPVALAKLAELRGGGAERKSAASKGMSR
jgi:tetratricopeptide (TPR) repeat protein